MRWSKNGTSVSLIEYCRRKCACTSGKSIDSRVGVIAFLKVDEVSMVHVEHD